MDLPEWVRLAALQAVWTSSQKDSKQDSEYHLRRIFRWYSKTFFTPLADVEMLPLYDVLQTYFESTYEAMLEEQGTDKPGTGLERLDAERLEVIEPPEALAARQKAEDADDLELYLMAREEARTELAKSKKAGAGKLEEAAAALRGLGGSFLPAGSGGLGKETGLNMRPPSKGDAQIVFADDLDLEGDSTSLGLLNPPSRSPR